MASLADAYETWPNIEQIVLNLSRMAPNMRDNASRYTANPTGKTPEALSLEIKEDAAAFIRRAVWVEDAKVKDPVGFAKALALIQVGDDEITATLSEHKAAAQKLLADMDLPVRNITVAANEFLIKIPDYTKPKG